MLSFKKARKIAESWVEIVTDGDAAIDRELTQTRPYGWLFCWNSKKYLSNRENTELRLVGNVPIFIDRVNGELYVAGPAGIDWFAEYEASIPSARLEMKPEEPDWSD